MSPYGYVDLYHQLPIKDDRLGLDVTLDITKYYSGWAKGDLAEADTILGLIGSKQKPVKSAWGLTPWFYMKHDGRFDPDEPFVPASIRRAFCSRGSPSDMKDALRLAYATGRCSQLGPKAYAEKWFGQDCNSFVGNYLGLSPMISIGGFAKGYGTGKINGSTPDIEACRNFLPFPLVEDVEEICGTDIIVTFGSPDKEGSRFRHIALVHNIDGDQNYATVKIAEWGTNGGSAKHKNLYQGPLIPDLSTWKPSGAQAKYNDIVNAFRATFPKKKAIAFLGKDPNGQEALRVFHDTMSVTWANLDERGYEIAGRFGL